MNATHATECHDAIHATERHTCHERHTCRQLRRAPAAAQLVRGAAQLVRGAAVLLTAPYVSSSHTCLCAGTSRSALHTDNGRPAQVV